MKTAGRFLYAASALLVVCSICMAEPNKAKTAAAKPAKTVRVVFTEQQLEKLSRALKQPSAAAAYAQLSNVASQKASGILGIRAALAVGYYDYQKGNYALAAKWLAKAQKDPLLADSALYWLAENELAQRSNAAALDDFKRFRKEYPDSVMTDPP